MKEALESVWWEPPVMPDCDDSVDIQEAELPVERIDAEVPRFSSSPVLCCFFKRRPWVMKRKSSLSRRDSLLLCTRNIPGTTFWCDHMYIYCHYSPGTKSFWWWTIARRRNAVWLAVHHFAPLKRNPLVRRRAACLGPPPDRHRLRHQQRHRMTKRRRRGDVRGGDDVRTQRRHSEETSLKNERS